MEGEKSGLPLRERTREKARVLANEGEKERDRTGKSEREKKNRKKREIGREKAK